MEDLTKNVGNPGKFEDDDSFYDEEELGSGESATTLESLGEGYQKEIVEEDKDLEGVDAIEEKDNTHASEDTEEDVEPEAISFSLDDDEMEEDSEAESYNDVISPEERIKVFSDKIISCCVGNKSISRYAIDKLMSITSPRIFRDENYVLFTVLYNFRSRLRFIHIDEEFLRLYLNRNRNLLQKGRAFIDLNAYGEVDGSVELGYIAGVCKHFKRLVAMEELSVEDFETYFEKYLIEFKAIEAAKVYNQAQQILGEGLRLGKYTLSGFDDSVNFSKKRLAEIEGLVDNQKGSGFTSLRELLMEEKDETKKSEKISDFARLSALNKVYGGIYTGMFYSLLAPPKSGKSKLSARIVHTTSVLYGNNVSVWAIEGGSEAFSAQLRAIHFDYIYNTGASITEKKFGVSQDVILKDSFATEELRQLEMSSKLDLASNQEYGNVDFIDRPFNVETFIEEIDTSVKGNNSRLLIIDYLQLIGSEHSLNERERTAEAYRKLLVYCKAANIAVFVPAQYKQETINAMLSKNDSGGFDLRTAGGSSSEVIRTPDVNLAIWASANDLMNNKLVIKAIPSRMNVMFPDVTVNADLGVCQFISVDNG